MTRQFSMKNAHPAWSMMANLHQPPDATVAIRELAAQGLKQHDIADRLGVGVGAVEQVLRDAETMPQVPA